MPKKLLLFDIDGTLLRAGQAAERAFHTAFTSLFNTAPVADNVVVHGNTDPIIHREIAIATLGHDLSCEQHQALSSKYSLLLEDELKLEEDFLILPGVLKLLKKLSSESDHLLGVQTGNLEAAAKAKLRHANLLHHFKFGGFASDHEIRSEFIKKAIERISSLASFSPSDIIVIGDTANDIAAGKAIGAKTIAVSTGVYSSEELSQHSPDLVLEDLSNHREFFNFITY